MKTTTALFLMLMVMFTTNPLFAQSKENNSNVQSEHPLKNFYGQEMRIGMHKKNNIKIGHKGNDYVKFNEDGYYEQNWNGIVTKSSWTYDADKKTITVAGQGTWVVTSVEADKLNLTKDKEVISLFILKN